MGRKVIRPQPRAEPRAYVGKRRDHSNVWKPSELPEHYNTIVGVELPLSTCTKYAYAAVGTRMNPDHHQQPVDVPHMPCACLSATKTAFVCASPFIDLFQIGRRVCLAVYFPFCTFAPLQGPTRCVLHNMVGPDAC